MWTSVCEGVCKCVYLIDVVATSTCLDVRPATLLSDDGRLPPPSLRLSDGQKFDRVLDFDFKEGESAVIRPSDHSSLNDSTSDSFTVFCCSCDRRREAGSRQARSQD
jgi:hypothetical protein